MSGGSWDYITFKLDDAAARLKGESDPLRRLLGERVTLLAKAMHDIEWVDSGDKSPGKEVDAIKAFLSAEIGDDVKGEINAIADRSMAEIETLRRLVNDKWGHRE